MAIVGEKDAGFITYRVREFREKWCLYSHCLGKSTEIFFLGTSKLCEVYEMHDAWRNSFWRQHVNNETLITIRVLATMDNHIEARQALRRIYDECRPIANVNGHQVAGKIMVTCIQGDRAGQSWETATRCADECAISAGALSNHLNGRRGYENIRGMKFKKGY